MTTTSPPAAARRKAVWGPRVILGAALAWSFVFGSGSAQAASHRHQGHHVDHAGAPNHFVRNYKIDDELDRRSKGNPNFTSKVIVELKPGKEVPPEFRKYFRGDRLDIINGQALELPNGLLKKLASHGDIFRVHEDRPIQTHNYRTSLTVGADTVRNTPGLGFTGAGIGVAVIDSGIATWHDDLTNKSYKYYPYGNQRVSKFVDFVNHQSLPYDDNGHGSHVAGTILGNGTDSNGAKAGIAPDASLVSLKVLDANGQGTISTIIAALNWIALNGKTYNVRVVNMSVGAPIRESYWTDPLTLAAKAVTDKGITVVAAAGNFGKNAAGHLQYGGITAPGNAPWVLTVGASSTNGTTTRVDDTMADYSSIGPSYIDFLAKPDLVAPGTGTVSLAVPGSTFYTTKAQYLVPGVGGTPYLALSGTSMATPVVSGTVALMLQANPNLTPNLIKAILQYTAQVYPGYSPLREGAGFLNTYGAVRLARFYATARTGDRMPSSTIWSKQIIWGNHRLKGGYLKPTANAWASNIVWGSFKTSIDTGDNIVWGTLAADLDNIVWGTSLLGDNIVWGTSLLDDNIVWGTVLADNIVWGTSVLDDNIVWGTDCGGFDCDNIVWGTLDNDNIVWGTALLDDNIVWGTSVLDDNIVWGTAGLDVDNIVWGTAADQDVTWGSNSDDDVLFSDDVVDVVPDVASEFGDLFPVTEGGL